MNPFHPQRYGEFFLLDLLGKGGMAEVFLATTFPLAPSAPDSTPFALKRLLPRYSSSRAFVQRLVVEAKLAALLHHPNLVEVHDLGTCGTDFYLQMEWVNGKGLNQLLERVRSFRQEFPPRLTLFLLRELALALAAVHNARDGAGRSLDLVHCDITPQNILVSYEGAVKIADFGIATAQRSEKTTAAEMPMGKLPYMAPEQILRGAVDRRIDLYSLGVILFEIVTGQKPFEDRSSVELQQKILHAPPPLDHPLLSREPEIASLIAGLLEKDPAARIPTAEALLARIPNLDPLNEKSNLAQWMATAFSGERTAEKERMARGFEALRREPIAPDDLLTGVPQGSGSGDITDAMAKPEPPSETRVVFKSPRPDEAPPVAKVELVKKQVARVVESVPVEEIQEIPPASALVEKSLYESSTPGMTMEEVSLRDIEISAPSPLPPPGLRVPEPPTPEPHVKVTPTELPPSPRKPYSWRWLQNTLLGLLAVSLLGAGLYFASRQISKPRRAPDLPIEIVEVYVSVEGAEQNVNQDSLRSWKNEKERLSFWEAPLSRFFTSEYRRLTGKANAPFVLTLRPPVSGAPAVTWAGSLLSRQLPFRELSEFFGIPPENRQSNAARIFVHLYPKTYEEQNRYPLDLSGNRPRRQGVIYLPLSPKEDGESRVRLAHEITHVLGAKDKYDDRGLPDYPEGFVDPLRDPLYPQEFGEIMTRGIPETPDRYRAFGSLKEVRIGDVTAREIGWVETKR